MHARHYFALAFGSMIGVGWMIVIDDWLERGGSLGAMLGFLVGGLLLVPVGYVYGRLTQRVPAAGGEIAYTRLVFPAGVSYAAGWSMTLAYLIVCPYEAVAIGTILSYLAPQMNVLRLYTIGGYSMFLPNLVVGLVLTASLTTINYRGVRLSATFQSLTTFGVIALMCAFSALALAQGSVANLPPLFADKRGLTGGLVSTLLVLQIVPYFLTGFETIPKCSEEAAPDFDPRSFVTVTLVSLGTGIVFYVGIIGVVSILQPWTSLTHQPFATAVAFERAFGSRLLVRLVMLAALLSLLKVFNGNFLAASRVIFAMGRSDLIDTRLGFVHPRFRTPASAVVLVGLLTAVASFLGRAVLVPISEVGSFAAAVGWLATCLAFCAGAAGSLARREWLIGLCGALVSTAMLAMKVLPFVPGSFRRFEYLALLIWVLFGAFLWQRAGLRTGTDGA